MTLSDWLLAATVCLLLSAIWSVALFGACRVAEIFLPSADDRHLLWWIGLLAAAAPLAAFALPSFAGTNTGPAGSAPFFGDVLGTAGPPATGVAHEAAGFFPVVLGALGATAPFVIVIYGLGLTWHLLVHLSADWRLQRLLASCRPLDKDGLPASVAGWAARLGLKNVPSLLMTPEACSPFSARWRRPVLVLPAKLVRQCPPEQIALICAHELAHVARGDLVFMRVQNIMRALLWFNPVARAISMRIDITREAACDGRVLSMSGDSRRDYAQAFLAALRHSAGRPVCGISFIHPRRKDHEMRLTHIMNGRPGSSRKLRVGIASLALVMLAVPMAGAQAKIAKSLAEGAPQFTGTIVAASGARLTSPYGPRILRGKENFHHGVDIGAPFGTPVKSPGNGRVLVVSGDHKGYGKRIEIDYGDGWKIIFSQLSSYDVAEGDTVTAGQQVGKVGMSGVRATGPHLHLEILHNGDFVDPATVLALPGQSKGGAARPAAGEAEACKEHPVPIHRPAPAYPYPGLEGSVVVEFAIGADGRTKDVKVAKSTDERLNKAAVDAVKQWRYEPPCVEGKEFKGVRGIVKGEGRKGVKVVIEFKMNKKEPEQEDKEPSAGK